MKQFIEIYTIKSYSFIGAILIALIVVGCAAPNNENLIKNQESPSETQKSSTEMVSNIARQKIHSQSYIPTIEIQTQNIKADKKLPTLYYENNYSLLWIDSNGPTSNAYEMIEVIRKSSDEALIPDDYNIKEIDATLSRLKASESSNNPEVLAELELLLSNSFLKYAHDVHYGRVRAEQINLDLISGEKPVEMSKLLIEATTTNNVQGTLDSLMPKYPVYEKLKVALKQYREIEANGGWQGVPYGDKFKKGARGQRVVALRERLKVTGELDPATPNSEVFDSTLDIAVKEYQERNGLYVDGVVGKSTLEALNVPVEQRVSQIELTMERWRLLPQYMGNKYILVNIANYHLYGVENNNDRLNMRIVVGKPEWNTPMFSEEMTHIVMNPYWNIPPSIFKDDIAPRIRQDSEYLSKRGIDAVGLPPPKKIAVEESQTIEVAENVVTTESVETSGESGESSLSEAQIQNNKAQEEYIAKVLSGNYRLRQNPGPGNPLGQIKFLFPNKHSVYLHDTPNRGFFKRAQRNFSHGCIRVEKPVDLAEFVLAANGEWDQGRIQSSINSRRTRTVHLNQSIPVYILYFTSWVDDQGNVNFHKDIYGLDQTLLNALRTTRPSIDMATTIQ
jgi:murein L,D-transpeptidase YcbB/YkuD